MAVRCGKSHGYHLDITDVRRCYNGEDVEIITVGRPVATATSAGKADVPKPSEKQIRYVESLLAQRGVEYIPGVESLNRRTISPIIDTLKSPEATAASSDFRPDPRRAANSFAQGTAHIESKSFGKAPAFDPETLEDGFYVRKGEVYKVIVAVHGSGRKYAKVLNSRGEWDMASGAVYLLRPEMRMKLSEALEVAKRVANDVNGALYGRCFKCGRTLTAEDSIERYMGPVCAAAFS